MYNGGGFMKILIILIVALAALAVLFFLLRKLFYRLVDKRIAEFQSDLIAKQTAEIQNM